MTTVFEVCFWVGVSVTVINALLGAFFDIIDFGIDFDLDFDLGGLHLDPGNFLPLSPSLLFMFLTIFGGTGMILQGRIPLWLVIVLGIALGLLASFLVNRFVVRPLKRISEKESGGEADFIGMNATVTERIFPQGFGRISFVYEGNSISEPARSEDGKEIPTGTSVVVLEIRDKVYIVQPFR